MNLEIIDTEPYQIIEAAVDSHSNRSDLVGICIASDDGDMDPIAYCVAEHAPLLAAAPDLLAALEAIHAGDMMQGRESWTHADAIQEHYKIARAAIARAKEG